MSDQPSGSQGSALGGPSLAFGFTKKKTVQKVAVNVEEKKDVGQSIKGIEGSVIQVDGPDPSASSKTYVIPKIENTYTTGTGARKFTPSFKPPSSDVNREANGEDKFVLGQNTAPTISEYGLQRREAPKDGPSADERPGTRLTPAQLEDRAYKDHVEDLPDDPDLEAYESMPIEEFGKAMLRGMGWQDGMGVGRNRKTVDTIEYVKRPERLGLGAQPVVLPDDKTKPVKMGDKPKRTDLVLAPDADGRQRNVRKLDEKLVPRAQVQAGPQPGKQMVLLDGRHAGLTCTVLELLPKAEGRSERVRVRLTVSQEAVEVRAKELGERWEQPAKGSGSQERPQEQRPVSREPAPPAGDEQQRRRKEARSSSRERERERDRGGERDRGRGGGDGKDKRREREEDGGTHKRDGGKRSRGSDSDGDGGGKGGRHAPSWLLRNIKVRIVDKGVRGGKLYLKKAVVVDVHPGGTADLAVDDMPDMLQLPEAALETVVPKAEGSAVMVLAGPWRGSKARLLQCRIDDGVAAVQLVADFSVQRLMLDQVAQYVGHMDEE